MLTIRIKKQSDGGAALTCTRPDGSVTWQRQQGAEGRFFPYHDLTHYAVETVLSARRGFYALVADGWNLTDFAAPWPKGQIPMDARVVEFIVGFLDTERATRTRSSAAEFNEHAATYFASNGLSERVELTDDQLDRIRSRRAELFDRWSSVVPGGALELTFDVA